MNSDSANFDPSDFLLHLFRKGVAAASPSNCLSGHWPQPPAGRIGIIACGKAAFQMAAMASRHYGTEANGIIICPGIIPDSHHRSFPDPPGFTTIAASHPVPDERSMAAAEMAIEFASRLTTNDLLLFLVSGGGSSLMCLPAKGVSLEEKQRLTRRLLSCGATIAEINCVRKHLSRVKGGRLAAACRAPVVTLAISDVPGNDPALIASGPTLADRSSLAEARDLLAKHAIEATRGIRAALDDPANEAPGFGEQRRWDRMEIIASGMTALEAAAVICREQGIEPRVLGEDLEGEAAELGRRHARDAIELASGGGSHCLLSGGETTVTLSSEPGAGGRNTEYALALAVEAAGDDRVWALAADSDGIDGHGGHSGAIVEPATLSKARAKGLNPVSILEKNDSATLFRETGGLFSEGATHTNVNDFRAVLVNPFR